MHMHTCMYIHMCIYIYTYYMEGMKELYNKQKKNLETCQLFKQHPLEV